MKAFLSDSILFDYKNEYIYVSMYKTFTRSQRNFAVLKKKGHTVCDSTYITLLKCKIRRMENQWLLWTRDGCKEMVHMNRKR